MTTAANNFKALVARLNAEDRFFHMDDDIADFADFFTAEEQVEFAAIIEAAREALTTDEFDEIAYALTHRRLSIGSASARGRNMIFKVGNKVKLNDPFSDYHKMPAVVAKVHLRSYDIEFTTGLCMRVVPEQLIGSAKK